MISSPSSTQIPITPFTGVAGPSLQQALQQIAAGATGGTVTSVSVTSANGISGSVATPSSTPAITLTLGDITPSSVVCSTNATALPSFTPTPKIRVASADGINSPILADSFGGQATFTARVSGGTNAAKSAIPNNTAFLSLLGVGYGATGYSGNAAAIFFQSTEAWTDSAYGCRVRIDCTPNGSTTRTTAVSITPSVVTVTGNLTADSFAKSSAGNAPNGQAVTFDALSGPDTGPWTIKTWLPFTVNGVSYVIPCFGL